MTWFFNFSLTIGLGVKAGRQTGGSPQQLAEISPEGRRELGRRVGNHVNREAMQAGHVLHQQLISLHV